MLILFSRIDLLGERKYVNVQMIQVDVENWVVIIIQRVIEENVGHFRG